MSGNDWALLLVLGGTILVGIYAGRKARSWTSVSRGDQEETMLPDEAIKYSQLRIRSWLIGAILVVGGFTMDLFFEVSIKGIGGRGAMADFGCMEAMLFIPGFVLVLVAWSIYQKMSIRNRAVGCLALFTVALFAGFVITQEITPLR